MSFYMSALNKKRICWGSLLCLFIGMGIAAGLRHKTDFIVYYKAAQFAMKGETPYYFDPGTNVSRFRYPPVFAVLFYPFSVFPEVVGKVFWYFANAAALAAAFLLCRGLFSSAPPGVVDRATALTGLMVSPFVIYHLSIGQSKLLMMFFLVLSFYGVVRKKDFWAGFAFVLAVVIYFPMVVFLLFFMIQRKWKFLLGTFFGAVMFFGVLPLLVFGISKNMLYLRQWYHMLLAPFLTESGAKGYGVLKLSSQSLPSALARFFQFHPGGRWELYIQKGILDLDQKTFNLLVKGIFSVLVGLSCAAAFLTREKTNTVLAYSSFIILTLLLPEYSLTYTWVLMLIPCFSLLVYAFSPETSLGRKKIVFATLAVFILSFVSGASNVMRAHSSLCWGTLFVWGTIVAILFMERRDKGDRGQQYEEVT